MAKRTFFEEYQYLHSPVKLELSDEGVVFMQVPQGLQLETYNFLSSTFADLAGDLDIKAVLYTEFAATVEGSTEPPHTTLNPGQLPQVEVAGKKKVDLSSFLGMDERAWFANQMLCNELEVGVPMIAAVNDGSPRPVEPIPFAVPLLMDIVISSENAIFQDPHFVRGFVPGDGMTLAINTLVGPARARYFSLTGYRLTAREAQEWGLVHEVYPQEKVLDRAWDLARRIAKRPSTLVRNTRDILVQDIRRAFLNDLRHQNLAELWASRQYFMGAGGRDVMSERLDEISSADRLIDVIDPAVFDVEQRPTP